MKLKDGIYILPPNGLSAKGVEGYRELIIKFRRTSMPPEGMLENVVLIAQCFKQISDQYGNVSPDLDIVIMDINGNCHYLYLNSQDYLNRPLENFKQLSKGSYLINPKVVQETKLK
ncbi:hypothetical protein ACFL52_02695 [Candidatus Margulisiibacteriota bacterium]